MIGVTLDITLRKRAERRASEVRVDRVIRVDPHAVRREGAVLDRARFDAVARSLVAARG